jgi:hypothetical protein
MSGTFVTLGGFLLFIAAIAIGTLLLAAVTGFQKIDKDVL